MWQDIRFSARDGTQLYGRRYAANSAKRPLLCLGGIVGNSAQFDVLASALANNGAERRSVFTIDCRGRGRSGALRAKQGSPLLTECEDVLDFMTICGLDEAAVLGTGHGGQLAMIMAQLQPRAVGALILNDSAPELEIEGVVRLLGEAASLPVPQTWVDAAGLLQRQFGRRYPKLSAEQWQAVARSSFLDVEGRPARAFDPAIAAAYSLSRGTLARHTLWAQFAALSRVPVLFLRAELSDMVSPQTITRMRGMHPALEVVTVPREGHPALLRDAPSIAAVATFLARNEWQEARSETAFRAVA